MAHLRTPPVKPNYPFERNRGSPQAFKLGAWWPGEPSGGSIVYDLSGLNQHATTQNLALTAASGWSAGVNGGRSALTFDGVNDRAELTGTQSSNLAYFAAAQAFSVSCWIKVLSQPSNTHGYVAGVRVNSVGNGWYIYWEKATSTFIFGYQGLNNNHHFRNSSARNLNQWYHVIFSRDGSNTLAGHKIYINGVNDAGTTDTNGTPSDISFIGTPQFSWGNDAQNTTYPNNASMEDLRVYNKAHLSSDAMEMYSNPWALRSNPTRKSHYRSTTINEQSTSNSVVFTESADSDGVFPRSASNTLVLTEVADSDGVFPRSASNSITFSQDAGVSTSHFANNTVTFTESATYNIVDLEDASNTLVFTQTAVAQFTDVEYVPLTVTFSQSLSFENANRHISNSLTFVSSGSSTNVYSPSVTDTLVFSVLAEVEQLRIASSTITFTQDTTTELTTHASNALVLTQDALSAYTLHSDYATSTLDITGDGVVVAAVRPRSVTSTLTFVSVVTATHVRHVSASNTLVITNQAFNTRVSITSNTLTLTDDATALNVHIRSASSTLVFTQTVLHPTTYIRSLSNTLVFTSGYYKSNGSGGSIFIPAALPVKVETYCTLQIPGLAITLPQPLLGDSEGTLGSIDLKRTMTGGTYTYVKRSASRELKYKFEITRAKAYEMRNFIQYALSTKVLLTNWKGELWYGNIMNNPFEFTAESRAGPCGETYQIDFDFQGVRMN